MSICANCTHEEEDHRTGFWMPCEYDGCECEDYEEESVDV